MTRRAITPHPLATAPGQLVALTIVLGTSLYVLIPASREVVATTAPLLMAMLPATLAGSTLRVAVDLYTGRRFTLQANDWWQAFVLALICVVLAAMILHVGVDNALQSASTLSSLQGMLAVVIAAGMSLLALGAGLAYGDDHTWRREHGLD